MRRSRGMPAVRKQKGSDPKDVSDNEGRARGVVNRLSGDVNPHGLLAVRSIWDCLVRLSRSEID
jgi:hypothetical protein